MKYSIEKAKTYQYGVVSTYCYYINKTKIEYVSNRSIKYRGFQLNTSKMVMTPGYVMFDFDLINITLFSAIKERMTFLQRIGCTTVITVCDITEEKKFDQQLKQAKHDLINSTVDFLVSVRTPLSNLTSTFVRRCKHHKVPIIFVIVNNLCDLSKVRWQEIKNETFQYDIHFYPVWNCSDVNRAVAEQVWNYTLDYYRLLTCHKPLKQHKPLDKRTLRSLGIYPQKGTLLIGNDADYLLFNENQFLSANNKCLLNPSVVVLRGKVIKAGGTMFIYPGNGKENTINLPRRFVPIDEAYPIKTID